jgi:magnesium-transporting ATPase (P-type)
MLAIFAFKNQFDGAKYAKYDGMTMAFLTIAISQALHALTMRSNTICIFSKQNERNFLLPILMCVAILIVLILAMISMYANANQILGMNKMQWAP